jgi:four helix bundle protein
MTPARRAARGFTTEGDDRMGENASDNPIRSYRDLIAWQQARALVKATYMATKAFPKEEVYGLTQQIRRAAVSVPSNIAEGYKRGSRRDYVHFLRTARGSLYELQTQLILCQDLGYLDPSPNHPLCDLTERCSKLLHGLIKSLPTDEQE